MKQVMHIQQLVEDTKTLRLVFIQKLVVVDKIQLVVNMLLLVVVVVGLILVTEAMQPLVVIQLLVEGIVTVLQDIIQQLEVVIAIKQQLLQQQ
jgi:hypothetical protein